MAIIPSKTAWGISSPKVFAAIATAPWTTTYVDDPIDPEYDGDTEGPPNLAGSLAADQSIAKNTWTVVGFDTTDWGAGLTYDAATDTVTVSESGAYAIDAAAVVEALDAAAYCQAAIYTTPSGGSETLAKLGARAYNDSAAARDTGCDVSAPNQFLQANEAVAIKVRQSGDPTTIAGDITQTWFTIRFLG